MDCGPVPRGRSKPRRDLWMERGFPTGDTEMTGVEGTGELYRDSSVWDVRVGLLVLVRGGRRFKHGAFCLLVRWDGSICRVALGYTLRLMWSSLPTCTGLK